MSFIKSKSVFDSATLFYSIFIGLIVTTSVLIGVSTYNYIGGEPEPTVTTTSTSTTSTPTQGYTTPTTTNTTTTTTITIKSIYLINISMVFNDYNDFKYSPFITGEGTESNPFIIENYKFYRNITIDQQYMFEFSDNNLYLIIRNCEFYQLDTNPSGSYIRIDKMNNLIIENNQLGFIQMVGIRISSCNNTLFLNNIFNQAYFNIHISLCNNTIFENNQFITRGRYWFYGFGENNNMTIFNNLFNDTNQDGSSSESSLISSNLTIEHNTFTNNILGGFTFTNCDNITVKYNKFINITFDLYNSDNVSIEFNYFTNTIQLSNVLLYEWFSLKLTTIYNITIKENFFNIFGDLDNRCNRIYLNDVTLGKIYFNNFRSFEQIHSLHNNNLVTFYEGNSLFVGNYWEDYEIRYPDAEVLVYTWDTTYIIDIDFDDIFPLTNPRTEITNYGFNNSINGYNQFILIMILGIGINLLTKKRK